MYKIIYFLHISFSFFLIIIIFLQKGSNILQGSHNYFQNSLFTKVYVNKKIFLNLSIFFLFLFLCTSFFLVYGLLNFSNYEGDNVDFNMLLFCNKCFYVLFLENLEFPKITPVWWN